MGLIDRNEAEGLYSPYIEHYNADNNRHAPPTDSDDSDASSLVNQRVVRQPRLRRNRPMISVSQENLANAGRKLGMRKRRRVDNLKYLIGLDEKDSDMGDTGCSFESPTTLFERLLNDPDQMEIWNRFVESSEEEQSRMLNYRGLHDIKEEERESEEDEVMMEERRSPSNEESWVMILDKRSTHPAYTPKECYNRVEKGLRQLLKRRQLPLGMLSNLEREVVTFFSEWPSSVYVCDISNGFERMLLHGLCQYLRLSAKSFDANGTRKTQIENKMQDFKPPSLLLTEYLQQNQHSL